MIELNKANTVEDKIKELIKEIEKIENMYLDKKAFLTELRQIIKNK